MTEACDSEVLNCLKLMKLGGDDSVHSCPQLAGSKACRSDCCSKLRRADAMAERAHPGRRGALGNICTSSTAGDRGELLPSLPGSGMQSPL